MNRVAFKGFDELYIHDVPVGAVLNKDTVDNYPIKFSGSFISKNGNYMIQSAIYRDEGEWEIFPWANNGRVYNEFYKILDGRSSQGSYDYIQRIANELLDQDNN